jgi:hypothetical protein
MTHFDPEAREREALEEMDATSVGRRTALALTAAFLLAVAAGPALELVAAADGGSRVWAPLAPVLAGVEGDSWLARSRAVIAELETRLDERSELVRRVRPPAQEALFRLLRYGNERAYVGRDGWLFFRPDFDHLTRARPVSGFAGDPAAAVVALHDDLAARGVELLVVPAPVKLAIEPGRFVRPGPDAAAAPLSSPRDASLRERLATAGVELYDPGPLLALAARTEGAAYLERDTHWAPRAMDAVARALALTVRAVADLPAGDPDRYREEPATVAAEGDIAALLGLPPGSGLLPRERVAVSRVLDADGRPWRPVRGAPVLLLGDSFTGVYSDAGLGWGGDAGLAERLSLHLGLPVDRIVRNAGGASATRRELAAQLAADPGRLDGVRVVVWEFAARELTEGDWARIPLATPQTGGRDPAAMR